MSETASPTPVPATQVPASQPSFQPSTPSAQFQSASDGDVSVASVMESFGVNVIGPDHSAPAKQMDSAGRVSDQAAAPPQAAPAKEPTVPAKPGAQTTVAQAKEDTGLKAIPDFEAIFRGDPVATTPDNGEELPDASVVTPVEAARARSRDLSGFPEDKHPILRKMSNQTWEYVAPLLKQAQEAEALKTKLAEAEAAQKSWMYGHEESYKLAPEFAQYSAANDRLKVESNFWQQQLINLRSGKPVHTLAQNADGQLVYGQQLDSQDPATEVLITQNMHKAAAYQAQLSSEMQQWQASHKSEVTSTRQRLAELERTLLGSGTSAAAKPYVDQVLAAIPAQFRSQPEYRIMAGLYGTLQLAVARIKELSKQAQGTQVVNQARAQVPATQTTVGRNGTTLAEVNGDTNVADILKLLPGGIGA